MKPFNPSHFCNKCGNRVSAVETRMRGVKYLRLPWFWCNICNLLLEPYAVHESTKLGHIEGTVLINRQIIDFNQELVGFGTYA